MNYFNPRTPLQSATQSWPWLGLFVIYFNPRTPLQSATDLDQALADRLNISIHALHYRVRRDYRYRCCHDCQKFQSTHSITECDSGRMRLFSRQSNFNPRTPLQSATLADDEAFGRHLISIHALHYRVRRIYPRAKRMAGKISIHALHYRVRQNYLHSF